MLNEKKMLTEDTILKWKTELISPVLFQPPLKILTASQVRGTVYSDKTKKKYKQTESN